MIHGLTTTAGGVIEIPPWSNYRYVLAFARCLAIVTATFRLFMDQGWGPLRVPASFSWPQLHVPSIALGAR